MVIVLVVAALAFTLSPRPGSFVIRAVSEQGAANVKQTMETHAPSRGVTAMRDQPYQSGGSATRLDVYLPESAAQTSQRLPAVVWMHGGTRSVMSQMSTIDQVTAAFPPAFISGGNGDPLTDRRSRPLAAKVQRLGVPVSTLLFPPGHEPSLAHETSSTSTRPM